MGEARLSKDVYFLGVWRVHNVTDYLHRQITEQMHKKKGYAARLDLTSEGIELFILHRSGEITRRDNIPLQTVRDITINRHVTSCLMVIIANRSKELNVLVFLSASDKDASEMVRTFQKVKSKLSGEGFNFDLKAPAGTNWTMKTSPRLHRHSREIPVVAPIEMKMDTHEGNNFKNSFPTGVSSIKVNIDDFDSGIHKEMVENSGKILFNVGVQTGANVFDDQTSTSSGFASNSSLKDELHQLTEEVRAIKVMLDDVGISDAQYFKRQTNTDSNDEMIVTEILPESEDKKREGSHNKYYQTQEDFPVLSYDARSYGTQTNRESESHRYRKNDQHMPLKYLDSSLNIGPVHSAKGYYVKRVYESENPLTTEYILVQHPGRQAIRYSKGQSLPAGLGFRHRSTKQFSTIEKPIEEVYGRHHSQFKIFRSRLSNLHRSSAPIVLNSEYSKHDEIVIGTASNGGVNNFTK